MRCEEKSNNKYFIYGIIIGFATITAFMTILFSLFKDDEEVMHNENVNAIRSMPNLYANNEKEDYWTIDSCIAVENLVTYDELTFDYEITGDYESIVFKDNTMFGKTTYTDKSVKFKSYELMDIKEGSTTIIMCYKITSRKYDDCKNLKLMIKNLTLYNSNNHETYKLAEAKHDILCYNNLIRNY